MENMEENKELFETANKSGMTKPITRITPQHTVVKKVYFDVVGVSDSALGENTCFF